MNLWAIFLPLRFPVFHDVILWCLDEAKKYLFQKLQISQEYHVLNVLNGFLFQIHNRRGLFLNH